MTHKTDEGITVDCNYPGPRTWYVTDQRPDKRGKIDGFDGCIYILESPPAGTSGLLMGVAIRRIDGAFKLIG